MIHAVCCVPVSPLRKEPSHKSEMVSQLLFGDYCKVIETASDQWIRIEVQYDGYEGWCREDQITHIDDAQFYKAEGQLALGWVTEILYEQAPMHVPFGSSLPPLRDGEATWGTKRIKHPGHVWNPHQANWNTQSINQIARMFMNTPYLWGGKTVFGVDCSGFTQMVFKFFDIPLNRDAHQQAAQGEPLQSLDQSRCGDLAFFDNPEGRITHVGILLNTNEIIHSSGSVRIDGMDDLGIIHHDSGLRTHRLRLIKRYSP